MLLDMVPKRILSILLASLDSNATDDSNTFFPASVVNNPRYVVIPSRVPTTTDDPMFQSNARTGVYDPIIQSLLCVLLESEETRTSCGIRGIHKRCSQSL